VVCHLATAPMALKRLRLKIVKRNSGADLKIAVLNFENVMCHTTEKKFK
jgi:hypothetical protein